MRKERGSVHVDTTDAIACLDEVRALLVGLNGQNIPLDYDRGENRQNKAELAVFSRELLRAIELLRLASSETSMLYWRYRGYRDPRFDAEHPGGFESPFSAGTT